MSTFAIICEDCDEEIVCGFSNVPDQLQDKLDSHSDVCDEADEDED